MYLHDFEWWFSGHVPKISLAVLLIERDLSASGNYVPWKKHLESVTSEKYIYICIMYMTAHFK